MFRTLIAVAVFSSAIPHYSMPVLSEIRRDAIDEVRENHRLPPEERYEAERIRLEAFFNNTEELLNFPEVIDERLQFELQKPPHVKSINEAYIGYDKEFGTRRADAWLWRQLLEESEYLSQPKREMIFGLKGFMNKGFPVEGPVPIYGAWQGRPMSEHEQHKLCALLGLAVAPEKTETAKFNEAIDLLGVECTPTEGGAFFGLSQKRKDQITKEMMCFVELLHHWEYAKNELTGPELLLKLQKLCGLCIFSMFSRKHKRNIPVTQGNTMAHALMSQTMNRLKKLGVEWSKRGAFPPNLTGYEKLTEREKRIFEFWMATGLRPKGEMFRARAPASTFSASILPITREELNKITKKLQTSLYGPRRALAIYLRLRISELGVRPLTKEGKASPAFLRYKQEVNKWMGWSPNSSMWEKVYAVDCWKWKRAGFQVHSLVRSYFDRVALCAPKVQSAKPRRKVKKSAQKPRQNMNHIKKTVKK
eukprot:g245.t1